MAIAKKKKRFFDVEIPIINRTTQLFAFDVEELDGKFIKYDLTRILKGKSILLDLKVSVKDNKAISIPVGLNLVPYYIRRMIRKGTDYVEDSISINCKNAILKIKPLLITRRKVSKAVRKALREKVKSELENELKSKNSEEIFEEILKNKLQKELSIKLKKIYPLSLCEIRSLKVEKELEIQKDSKQKTAKSKKETEETPEENFSEEALGE